MILIAREELIIGVVEGVLIAIAIIYAVGVMYWMALESCRHFLHWRDTRRKQRIWDQVLEGKVTGPGPAE